MSRRRAVTSCTPTTRPTMATKRRQSPRREVRDGAAPDVEFMIRLRAILLDQMSSTDVGALQSANEIHSEASPPPCRCV
jgi:hypothetical protein